MCILCIGESKTALFGLPLYIFLAPLPCRGAQFKELWGKWLGGNCHHSKVVWLSKKGKRLFITVILSLCVYTNHTHGCAPHWSDGYAAQMVGGQNMCLLFRCVEKRVFHIQPHKYTRTNNLVTTHTAVIIFHISCFPPASLLCATFHLCFQQQQACSATVNRNFVVLFPPYQNFPNRVLLFTCLLIGVNKGQEG